MATSKFTDIYYSNKCKQRQLQPKKPQQAGWLNKTQMTKQIECSALPKVDISCAYFKFLASWCALGNTGLFAKDYDPASWSCLSVSFAKQLILRVRGWSYIKYSGCDRTHTKIKKVISDKLSSLCYKSL
jgi:hypothetical protein